MRTKTCSVQDCMRPYSSKGFCKIHAERVRRYGTPELVGHRPGASMANRLWSHVDRSAGPEGCWPFTGRLNFGYGRIRRGGRGSPMLGAHRAAFLLSNPDAPEPEVVDHVCHDPRTCFGGDDCPHRRCCNPAHIEASTPAKNSAPDRQSTLRHRRNTCAAGHRYTSASTHVDPLGKRRCRICGAATARRRAAIRAEAA